MMFNKELLLSLCEKYNVELSGTVTSPMIKDGDQIHEVANNDVNRVFSPCQAYFGHSSNRMKVRY